MKKFIKKMTALLLSAAFLVMAVPLSASAEELPFTDVKPGAWYYGAVAYVHENDLFHGTSATAFSPQQGMTRAMLLQVLANMTGNYDPADYPGSAFSDVPDGSWCAPAAAWAAETGLVNGEAGELQPESLFTREEMACILYAYAAKTENELDASPDALEPFSDGDSVSSWSSSAMCWAVEQKIINGSAGNSGVFLNPGDTVTRAQAAQIFQNAARALANRTVNGEAALPGEDGSDHAQEIYRLTNEIEMMQIQIAALEGELNALSTKYDKEIKDYKKWVEALRWMPTVIPIKGIDDNLKAIMRRVDMLEGQIKELKRNLERQVQILQELKWKG